MSSVGGSSFYRRKSAAKKRKASSRSWSNFSGSIASSASARSVMSARAPRPTRYSTHKATLYQTIMPERVKTWIESTMDFYLVAGRSTAAAGNYMSVMVNTLAGAWNTTYTPTTAVGPTYAMNGQLVNGNVVTSSPVGYGSIAAFYNMYKVLKYKLEITVQPASATDACRCVMFPLGNEQIPDGTATNVNTYVFEAQPHAIAMTAVSGASAEGNRLTLSGSIADVLGKRMEQWLDLDGSLIASLPSTNDQAFVGFFTQQLNGANNASTLTIQCRLFQFIEFSDFNNVVA